MERLPGDQTSSLRYYERLLTIIMLRVRLLHFAFLLNQTRRRLDTFARVHAEAKHDMRFHHKRAQYKEYCNI